MVFAALQVPGALGVLGYKVLGYKVKRPSRKESISKEVQRGGVWGRWASVRLSSN